MSETLFDRIRRHEGFTSHVRLDSKGFLFLGYGTTVGQVSKEIEKLLIEHPEWLQPKGVGISEEQASVAVIDRVNQIQLELLRARPISNLLNLGRFGVVTEMAYQLGVRGCLNFKRMWKALDRLDYEIAAAEMLDPVWRR